MPSRRKQTVGSCQFAQGHCWSTPCGGASNLTEGSSIHRIRPIFCLEAHRLLLTVHTQPNINPSSCWFLLRCLSQCEICVDWATSNEHCNWGFITKRIDKTQQPSVRAMMGIFDGLNKALLCDYSQLQITACLHWWTCTIHKLMTAHDSFVKLTNVLIIVTSFIQVICCSWSKEIQPGDDRRFSSTGIWRGETKLLQASDSCSRSLALMSMCCLASLACVKPRLRPGSDWWSPTPQYCRAVFAPLNEAGVRQCLSCASPASLPKTCRVPAKTPLRPTLLVPVYFSCFWALVSKMSPSFL